MRVRPTYSHILVRIQSPTLSLSSFHDVGDQNGSVKIFDLGSSKCISDVVPQSRSPSTSSHGRVAIQSVDISDDARILVAANNHAEVFAWVPASAARGSAPEISFRAHPPGTYLLRARISPDCRTLATTGSDGTARTFDTSTWRQTRALERHGGWVRDAAFSADSSYLVTAGGDRSAVSFEMNLSLHDKNITNNISDFQLHILMMPTIPA